MAGLLSVKKVVPRLRPRETRLSADGAAEPRLVDRKGV